MRIDRAPYVVDLSRTQAVRKESADPAVQGVAPRAARRSPDRVEISPQARELQRLKQDMAALPDVRLDRVALAKQNMQYGRYLVDPVLVAQTMVESGDANIIKGEGA